MDLCHLSGIFERSALPCVSEDERPSRALLSMLRDHVRIALSSEGFIESCVHREFLRISERKHSVGLTPFFVEPRTGSRFAFGYWHPGSTPGPHEHTDWTITSVCSNELQVQTFDRDQSLLKRKLVEKNVFLAHAGEVGFVHEACVHCPTNISSEYTMSLHIASPLDGVGPTCFDSIIPEIQTEPTLGDTDHPYMSVLANRQIHRLVPQLVHLIEERKGKLSGALTQMAVELGSSRLRRSLGGRGESDIGGLELVLAHPDLQLRCEFSGGECCVVSETASSSRIEMRLDPETGAAVRQICAQGKASARELVGIFSNDEIYAIFDALEDSGLFARVRHYSVQENQ